MRNQVAQAGGHHGLGGARTVAHDGGRGCRATSRVRSAAGRSVAGAAGPCKKRAFGRSLPRPSSRASRRRPGGRARKHSWLDRHFFCRPQQHGLDIVRRQFVPQRQRQRRNALALGMVNLQVFHPAQQAGGERTSRPFALAGTAVAMQLVLVGITARCHHQAMTDQSVAVANQHRRQHADIAFRHFVQRGELNALAAAITQPPGAQRMAASLTREPANKMVPARLISALPLTVMSSGSPGPAPTNQTVPPLMTPTLKSVASTYRLLHAHRATD